MESTGRICGPQMQDMLEFSPSQLGEEDNLGSKGRDSETEPHSIPGPNHSTQFESNQAIFEACESSRSDVPAGVFAGFREDRLGLNGMPASVWRSRKHHWLPNDLEKFSQRDRSPSNKVRLGLHATERLNCKPRTTAMPRDQ